MGRSFQKSRISLKSRISPTRFTLTRSSNHMLGKAADFIVSNRIPNAFRSFKLGMVLAVVATSGVSQPVFACGGFFCQTVPIDQAGEQIVFRQEGSNMTAMVRILYSGDAEEFSWVVPVPNTPELSVGSDAIFDQLDLQTRPQFLLERRGNECEFALTDADLSVANSPTAEGGGDDGSVMVEERVVGPFDVQIVSSDNANELSNWLVDNGYDLSSRGEELIAPYVADGMKFVAVKLQSGQSSGSIQPLIMRYQTEKPMIPIRLTAVAAEEDMGVLVWVVAEARAVPENYLHVVPNYGRLNWFQGPRNAYISYQSLITAAMDEAGGQGFATDYAGAVTGGITAALTDPDSLQQQLDSIDSLDDASFIASAVDIAQPQQSGLDYLSAVIPPPGGFDQFVYYDPVAMQVAFTPEQLSQARQSFRQFLVERTIDAVRNGVALIPAGAYMTRLYTTLSPDEMTLDPVFAYNTGMPEQPVNRNATLETACTDNGTEWQLTLGSGTGREGEIVAQGSNGVPFTPPPEVIAQRAVAVAQTTSADAMPVEVTSNSFTAPTLGTLSAFPLPTSSGGGADDDDDGFLGSAGFSLSLLIPLILLRRFRRKY